MTVYMLHEKSHVALYGFILAANYLQTVEMTAISLYKHQENIVNVPEPIQSLAGPGCQR